MIIICITLVKHEFRFLSEKENRRAKRTADLSKKKNIAFISPLFQAPQQ